MAKKKKTGRIHISSKFAELTITLIGAMMAGSFNDSFVTIDTINIFVCQ